MGGGDPWDLATACACSLLPRGTLETLQDGALSKLELCPRSCCTNNRGTLWRQCTGCYRFPLKVGWVLPLTTQSGQCLGWSTWIPPGWGPDWAPSWYRSLQPPFKENLGNPSRWHGLHAKVASGSGCDGSRGSLKESPKCRPLRLSARPPTPTHPPTHMHAHTPAHLPSLTHTLPHLGPASHNAEISSCYLLNYTLLHLF